MNNEEKGFSFGRMLLPNSNCSFRWDGPWLAADEKSGRLADWSWSGTDEQAIFSGLLIWFNV